MSSLTSTKKSVLFVIYQTGIKGNGGVQSVTNIIKEIAPQNNIYILTQMETDFNTIWANAGARVIYRKPNKSHYINILLHNIYLFFLLRKLKVSIVHCNDIQSLVCSFLGSYSSKLIFNMRAVKGPKETYTKTWSFVLNYVDHIIVLSKDMMLRVIDHFPVVKNKISFSYSIIDFNKFKKKDLPTDFFIKNGLDPRRNYIGVVGRFQEDKQQNLFLKNCVAKLDKDFRNQNHFLLIGDFNPKENSFAKECLDIIKNEHLSENVTVIDFQDFIEYWYNLFTITIVPSKAEGLARCMIESLSCETPVVSFDVSSAKEILEDGNCGKVIPQNDFEKMNEVIINLVLSTDELEKMAYNGRELMKSKFSTESVVKEYIKYY